MLTACQRDAAIKIIGQGGVESTTLRDAATRLSLETLYAAISKTNQPFWRGRPCSTIINLWNWVPDTKLS